MATGGGAWSFAACLIADIPNSRCNDLNNGITARKSNIGLVPHVLLRFEHPIIVVQGRDFLA